MRGWQRDMILMNSQNEWLLSSKGCKSGSIFSGSSRPRDRSLILRWEYIYIIYLAGLKNWTNFWTSFRTSRWVNSMILWISGKNGRRIFGCSRRLTFLGTSMFQWVSTQILRRPLTVIVLDPILDSVGNMLIDGQDGSKAQSDYTTYPILGQFVS